MKRTIRGLAGSAFILAMLSGPVLAENPRAPTMMKIDPQAVATGERASDVIGASIVNEELETVGTVDDLIISGDDRILYAVVSVGGFLGIGDRLVVVSYDSLEMRGDDDILLRGATRESLEELPEFEYRDD